MEGLRMNEEHKGWAFFSKRAMSRGEMIGGAAGALSGGLLAAVLSSISDGKQNGKKKSFAKRLLKGLLLSGAGALGGGLAGAGIARIIGNQSQYSKNLDEARNIASKKGPAGKGRVLYVNFPNNKFEAADGTFLKRFPVRCTEPTISGRIIPIFSAIRTVSAILPLPRITF